MSFPERLLKNLFFSLIIFSPQPDTNGAPQGWSLLHNANEEATGFKLDNGWTYEFLDKSLAQTVITLIKMAVKFVCELRDQQQSSSMDAEETLVPGYDKSAQKLCLNASFSRREHPSWTGAPVEDLDFTLDTGAGKISARDTLLGLLDVINSLNYRTYHGLAPEPDGPLEFHCSQKNQTGQGQSAEGTGRPRTVRALGHLGSSGGLRYWAVSVAYHSPSLAAPLCGLAARRSVCGRLLSPAA